MPMLRRPWVPKATCALPAVLGGPGTARSLPSAFCLSSFRFPVFRSPKIGFWDAGLLCVEPPFSVALPFCAGLFRIGLPFCAGLPWSKASFQHQEVALIENPRRPNFLSFSHFHLRPADANFLLDHSLHQAFPIHQPNRGHSPAGPHGLLWPVRRRWTV